jgi:predicted amidophosphoribosyltransferase
MPEPPGLPVVHAATRYADEVRAVLLSHKERGALALATPLGVALAGAVRAGLREVRARADGAGRLGDAGTPVRLVPVPSARGAVRARGHDPARRIALAAAGELRRTGTPARVLAVLRQRRTVADQSGLTSRQRLDNLAGALAVAPGAAGLLTGGPVVLVDDLMTTGASLTEAARAVRAAVEEPTAAHGAVDQGSTAEGVDASGKAVGPDSDGEALTVVYRAGSRGRAGARRAGSTEDAMRRARGRRSGTAGAGRAGAVICAAVVAATPDSFEINRN